MTMGDERSVNERATRFAMDAHHLGGCPAGDDLFRECECGKEEAIDVLRAAWMLAPLGRSVAVRKGGKGREVNTWGPILRREADRALDQGGNVLLTPMIATEIAKALEKAGDVQRMGWNMAERMAGNVRRLRDALDELLDYAEVHRLSRDDCVGCAGKCLEEWFIVKAEADAALDELRGGSEEAET